MKVYLLVGTPLNYEFADVYVQDVYISEELAQQALELAEKKRSCSRNKESCFSYQVQAWDVQGAQHPTFNFPPGEMPTVVPTPLNS